MTRAALLATAVIAVAARAQGPPPPPPLAFSHVQQIVVSGPGHVPCKDNLGNDLPNTTFYTEVDLGPAVGTPTAAVRTRSGAPSYIHVSITFWRPSYAPNWFVGTFQMNPLTYNGQTIPMQPMSFAAVIYPGGTFTQTFTVGPLPSTVSWRHELCFSWTADWYSSGYCRQPLYVVYDWPVYPQQRPWLGVLNDACSWAEGESTASDVARELTLGLFFAQRFAYPDNSGSYWTDWRNGNPTTFRLSDFLQTAGYQHGNCVDVSDYLTIGLRAQGLEFVVQQHHNPLGPGNVFMSNPLCPIGSDPTYDWTYTTFAWAFHQLTVGDGLVWDACAAQKEDLAGNGYRNPPFSWPLFGYWQTPAGQMTRGLVASPRPSTPLLVFGPYVPDVQ